MFIWLRRDYATQSQGDVMLSFDPPEEGDSENWLELTTRDRHYKDIAKELERAARDYDKTGDYRSRNISLNLARKLREMSSSPETVN